MGSEMCIRDRVYALKLHSDGLVEENATIVMDDEQPLDILNTTLMAMVSLREYVVNLRCLKRHLQRVNREITTELDVMMSRYAKLKGRYEEKSRLSIEDIKGWMIMALVMPESYDTPAGAERWFAVYRTNDITMDELRNHVLYAHLKGRPDVWSPI